MHAHHRSTSARLEAASTRASHGPAHPHAPLPTRGATIRWATLYDLLVKVVLMGGEKRLRASTVDLAGLQPGEEVLEVGCGTGSLAMAAALKAGPGVTVYGTDAAPEMIARARRKALDANAPVDFREGLVEHIDFPDASFDVVLSSFMVHHLPDDLKPRAFSEIYRVLKPGGRLLVVDFEPPRRRLSRALMTVFLGRGMMQIDNSHLPPLLRDAGFTAIRTGRTAHPLASYAEGRKDA